jgi:hypothetical protein
MNIKKGDESYAKYIKVLKTFMDFVDNIENILGIDNIFSKDFATFFVQETFTINLIILNLKILGGSSYINIRITLSLGFAA